MEKLPYQASDKELTLDLISIDDLEATVEQEMDFAAYMSVYGGAGDEYTLDENREAFNKYGIISRSLMGNKDVDLKTSLFGIDLDSPLITCPIAGNGLMHQDGEIATMQGSTLANSIFCASTYSTKSLEEIRQENKDGNLFFQIYLNKDGQFNDWLLDQAILANAKAIIITADAPVVGNREWDKRLQFKFPFSFGNLDKYFNNKEGIGMDIASIFSSAKNDLSLDDIQYIKEKTNLPVIVKGIQCALDVERVLEAGADGIWVSNHGGRQLEGGPACIDLLEEVVDAVDKQVPIIFDSGIRRGQHVFKALALGADIVAIGRPILYGLNQGGALGVQSVYNQLEKELTAIMMMAGTKNIEEIQTKAMIKHH